ncbi:ACR085Cp [Eremothecium gossypii ATCC 10895]|uniref:ACR085Cp n=1 Tax=Eremothecium gossypii (strain ATCC 10895 / CBS 109.51 / FGSC 9923 / NRRL Y-1056) TaxID=284811 RepID=Q75C32_EREGS|nr:ACR085Cp [Eremothecium gossypii ATCC 10895]AAS51311.1 ACR085Cp [Eremothecium gossypii ATCC 10895]
MQEKDQITFENLDIEKIFGTSTNSKSCFCHVGSKVAYVASGGVVVSDIRMQDGPPSAGSSMDSLEGVEKLGGAEDAEASRPTVKICSQRFFCAYSAVQHEESAQSANVAKDLYGLCKQDQSILVKTGSWHENDNPDKVSFSSSSDLTPARLSPSKVKNRIKTISCLNLSQDGRYMIVGELGHKPRILVYSLAPDSNDFPVFVIQQHSFGVANLKFHPSDSRVFMSLGQINDGFLHVWRLTSTNVVLLGTNKNISSVTDVLWCNSKFITYGVRHLKEWRIDYPAPAGSTGKIQPARTRTSIKGKNIVLREFINATFIDATQLDQNRVLLLTDKNIMVSYENGTLSSVHNLETCLDGQVTSILADADNDTLWTIADGKIHAVSLEYILGNHERLKVAEAALAPRGAPRHPNNSNVIKNCSFLNSQLAPLLHIAENNLKGIITVRKFSKSHLLYVTTQGCLGFYDIANQCSYPMVYPVLNNIAGYKKIYTSETLLWSREGRFKKLDEHGEQISELDLSLEPDLPYPLGSESSIGAAEMFLNTAGTVSLAVGTGNGDLLIYEYSNSKTKKVLDTKAHTSKINDIVCLQTGTKTKVDVLVSIGRDRIVQVFLRTEERWELQQTLSDNKGNVIKMIHDDNVVYVASADRSITKYRFEYTDDDLLIYKEKILSIKSAPINIHLFDDRFLISTNDKQLLIYDKALEKSRYLKLLSDTDDPVIIDNLYLNLRNCKQEEIMCSSADKVLRCYNFTTGKLMKQYFGHSEPVVGLVPARDGKLLSISSNGCIFSWAPQSDQLLEQRQFFIPLTGISVNSTLRESLDEQPVSARAARPETIAPRTQYTTVSPVKLPYKCPDSRADSACSPRFRMSNQRYGLSSSKSGNYCSSMRSCIGDEDLHQPTLLLQLKLFRDYLSSEDVPGPEHDAIIHEIKLISSIIEPQNKLLEKYSDTLMNLIEEKFQKL